MIDELTTNNPPKIKNLFTKKGFKTIFLYIFLLSKLILIVSSIFVKKCSLPKANSIDWCPKGGICSVINDWLIGDNLLENTLMLVFITFFELEFVISTIPLILVPETISSGNETFAEI